MREPWIEKIPDTEIRGGNKGGEVSAVDWRWRSSTCIHVCGTPSPAAQRRNQELGKFNFTEAIDRQRTKYGVAFQPHLELTALRPAVPL